MGMIYFLHSDLYSGVFFNQPIEHPLPFSSLLSLLLYAGIHIAKEASERLLKLPA